MGVRVVGPCCIMVNVCGKELLNEHLEEVLRIAAAHGAKDVRVFGSVARSEERPDSDIDILVRMEDDRNLLDVVGFWQDLTDLLGRKVDVLTEGGISPHLRDRIYSEAITL